MFPTSVMHLSNGNASVIAEMSYMHWKDDCEMKPSLIADAETKDRDILILPGRDLKDLWQ